MSFCLLIILITLDISFCEDEIISSSSAWFSDENWKRITTTLYWGSIVCGFSLGVYGAYIFCNSSYGIYIGGYFYSFLPSSVERCVTPILTKKVIYEDTSLVQLIDPQTLEVLHQCPLVLFRNYLSKNITFLNKVSVRIIEHYDIFDLNRVIKFIDKNNVCWFETTMNTRSVDFAAVIAEMKKTPKSADGLIDIFMDNISNKCVQYHSDRLVESSLPMPSVITDFSSEGLAQATINIMINM